MSRVLRQSAAAKQVRGYASAAGAPSLSPPGTVNFTLAVRAGPRYEPKPGVAHALKNFAYKSNAAASALKIARESELYGAQLTAALTREHLLLSASCLRGDESRFLSVIGSVLSSTHFYPHELTELVLPIIQTESAQAANSSITTALESLHRTAFRRGLGNSLYASPFSPVSAADIKSFAHEAFAKSNVSLISNDISASTASSVLGGNVSFGALPFQQSKTTYFGGESRVPMPHDASPAIAIGFGDEKPASAVLKVLAHVFGGAPSVKWGNRSGILDLDCDVESRALSYSDASLLTIVMSAPTNAALASAARAFGEKLTAGFEIPKEVVEAAKQKALLEEAAKKETLAGQVALALEGTPEGDIAKVTPKQCVDALNKMLQGKPTMVVAGDVDALPYADEIGLWSNAGKAATA